MNFYSEHHSCRKCGARPFAIGTKFTQIAITGDPVIRRTCGRCGHVWDEKPLDAQEELEPVASRRADP